MNKLKKINIIEIKDNKIPNGIYCYSLSNEENKKKIYHENKEIEISFPKTKNCCFLKKNKNIHICEFLNNEEIEDKLKICGVNVEF